MRLFIAIRIQDDAQKQVLACLHELKKQGVTGTYVPGANLHLTLAFIGETDRAADIREVMRSIGFQPFHLSFDGSGNFGSTIWAGVKGNQKLKSTVRQLREGLKEKKIPFDDRKFVPHVTLIRNARSKSPIRVPDIKADMMVTGISLMKSEIRNGKRVYTEIFRAGGEEK